MKAIYGICCLFTLMSTLCWAQASSTPGDYASVWECDQSKFNWYCEEQLRQQEKQAPRIIDITKIKNAKAFREALDELKDRANMEPTPENMQAYISAQAYAFKKMAVFADTWRRMVWTTPELDYTLRRPVNNTAIRTHDEMRDNNAVMHLSKLAKEHGLMFFFRSDCPYCHKMAPTLKQFGQRYGIEILPVSLDGKGLPDFPSPKVNHGQAKALGVERVPALFIASRKTKEIAPIGFGVMSQAEIIDRIFVLTNTQPGETF